MLVDSHCHIHDQEFGFDVEAVLKNAKVADVCQLICIGTSAEDSEKAVQFANAQPGVWASIGLHPHDAHLGEDNFELLTRLVVDPKVVSIGECGLDYYYENSPKTDQKQALEYQLQLALSFSKPCVFHVREAFDDFWPIFDNFSSLKGVIHSFTADSKVLEAAIKRGLYIGLNGIMTFTKEKAQIEAAKLVPLEKLLLETDAPFLTPRPKRGTMNEPANVALVAAYLAELRGETLEVLTEATTRNARSLFHLDKTSL